MRNYVDFYFSPADIYGGEPFEDNYIFSTVFASDNEESMAEDVRQFTYEQSLNGLFVKAYGPAKYYVLLNAENVVFIMGLIGMSVLQPINNVYPTPGYSSGSQIVVDWIVDESPRDTWSNGK
jgi:hypothetical protein